MIRIGQHNHLDIDRLVEHGAYLTDGEDEVLLPRKWVPEDAEPGDRLRVFVYTDSDDRPIATLEEPYASVGEFACLRVVDGNAHGSFVDWGLDKDVFVPFKEQHQRLMIDDRKVFYLTLHEATNRVIASNRLGRWFDYDLSRLEVKDEVEVMVYAFNDLGAHVVVDGRYRGIIYHNEVFRQIQIGDKFNGWIKEIREDNRLDVTLQRQGRRGQLDAGEIIMEKLEAAGGFLPLHDKSDPKLIVRELNMSKGVFKKAIGTLFKANRIDLLRGEGIRKRE